MYINKELLFSFNSIRFCSKKIQPPIVLKTKVAAMYFAIIRPKMPEGQLLVLYGPLAQSISLLTD